MAPFSSEQDKEHKLAAAEDYARPAGVTMGAAKWPAFRKPWVCNKIYDVHGNHVVFGSNLHPLYVGAGRMDYGWR